MTTPKAKYKSFQPQTLLNDVLKPYGFVRSGAGRYWLWQKWVGDQLCQQITLDRNLRGGWYSFQTHYSIYVPQVDEMVNSMWDEPPTGLCALHGDFEHVSPKHRDKGLVLHNSEIGREEFEGYAARVAQYVIPLLDQYSSMDALLELTLHEMDVVDHQQPPLVGLYQHVIMLLIAGKFAECEQSIALSEQRSRAALVEQGLDPNTLFPHGEQFNRRVREKIAQRR